MNGFEPRTRDLRLLVGVLAVGGAIFLAGTLLSADGVGGSGALHSVLAQMDLLRENNLATWWSSMVLLLIAVLCAVAWRADPRSPADGGPVLPVGWLFLVGVFALLSLDEVGSLHERISGDPALAIGTPSTDWVKLLALPIAGVALLMGGFALANLRRRPLPFALLILSVILFAAVPLQEELELSERVAGEHRAVFEALLEEGTELCAGLAAVLAVLLYLRRLPEGSAPRVRPPAIAAAAAALLVAMAICLVVIPVPTDPAYGYASAWFPAALGALATIAILARRLHPATGALAAAALLASAFFGSQARLWIDEQGTAHPVVRWAVPALLLVAVALACVATARAVPARSPVLTLALAVGLLALALAWGGTHPVLLDGLAMATLAIAAVQLTDAKRISSAEGRCVESAGSHA